MPDWQEFVRRRLAGLALDAAEKDELHAELAGHLQELYESLRRQGVPEQRALSQTWARVGDWDKLQQQIQLARKKENTMTHRTRRLWLPSLVTLLVAMIMVPELELLGLNPHFFFLHGPHGQEYAFPVYTVWLMLLPFVERSAPTSPAARAALALRLLFRESSRLWRFSSFSSSFYRIWDSSNTDLRRMRVPFSTT